MSMKNKCCRSATVSERGYQKFADRSTWWALSCRTQWFEFTREKQVPFTTQSTMYMLYYFPVSDRWTLPRARTWSSAFSQALLESSRTALLRRSIFIELCSCTMFTGSFWPWWSASTQQRKKIEKFRRSVSNITNRRTWDLLHLYPPEVLMNLNESAPIVTPYCTNTSNSKMVTGIRRLARFCCLVQKK